MVCERYEGGFGTMRINSTIVINTMNTHLVTNFLAVEVNSHPWI